MLKSDLQKRPGTVLPRRLDGWPCRISVIFHSFVQCRWPPSEFVRSLNGFAEAKEIFVQSSVGAPLSRWLGTTGLAEKNGRCLERPCHRRLTVAWNVGFEEETPERLQKTIDIRLSVFNSN